MYLGALLLTICYCFFFFLSLSLSGLGRYRQCRLVAFNFPSFSSKWILEVLQFRQSEREKGRKQEQVDEMREDEVEGANLGASILFNVYSFETRPTCAVNIAEARASLA